MQAEHTDKRYGEDLKKLREDILYMGGLVEDQIQKAIKSLVERDSALAELIIERDHEVNRLDVDIDELCIRMLALHQPAGRDLRFITTGLKITTDLERVGDMAVNIAEAARRYASHPPVKKLIDIPRMATTAQRMLRDALDSYVRGDMQLAQHVLDEDDELDSLKTQVFRELLTYMLQDPTTIEPALDLILISRHLERIGDHATNVAEDVIFMVSGRDVRHHAADQHP
jgi:phosphate transport system protein